MLKFCKEVVFIGWNWLSGCGVGLFVLFYWVLKGGVGKLYCCGGYIDLVKWFREVVDVVEMGVELFKFEVMEMYSWLGVENFFVILGFWK